MGDNTVEIRDQTFSANDLRAAYEDITEEDEMPAKRIAVHGTVVITGDGYHDNDVYVCNIEDADSILPDFIESEESVYTLLPDIEQNLNPGFVDFLNNAFPQKSFDVQEGTVYDEADVDMVLERVTDMDIDIIQTEEDVNLEYISGSVDGKVAVGVSDDR